MLAACATVPVVTTSSQCSNAQASVDQMNSIWNSLGQPAQYASEVQSITQSLQTQMPSAYAYLGVGVGMCATVFQIGIQADQLTNQMLSDSGQATVAGPTCQDATAIGLPSISSLALGSGTIILALGALYILTVLKK
jgi:hypothetical protein